MSWSDLRQQSVAFLLKGILGKFKSVKVLFHSVLRHNKESKVEAGYAMLLANFSQLKHRFAGYLATM